MCLIHFTWGNNIGSLTEMRAENKPRRLQRRQLWDRNWMRSDFASHSVFQPSKSYKEIKLVVQVRCAGHLRCRLQPHKKQHVYTFSRAHMHTAGKRVQCPIDNSSPLSLNKLYVSAISTCVYVELTFQLNSLMEESAMLSVTALLVSSFNFTE